MKTFSNVKKLLRGEVINGSKEYKEELNNPLLQSSTDHEDHQTGLTHKILIDQIVREIRQPTPNIDDIVLRLLHMKVPDTSAALIVIQHEAFKSKPDIQYAVMKSLLTLPSYGLAQRMDAHERTPLIEAASVGNASLVRLLLEHGAHIDHQDDQGNTALLMASRHDHVDVFKVLFQESANERLTNLHGENVWQFTHPKIENARKLGLHKWEGEAANLSISDLEELQSPEALEEGGHLKKQSLY